MSSPNSYYAESMLANALDLAKDPSEAPSILWQQTRMPSLDALLESKFDGYFVPEITSRAKLGSLSILNLRNPLTRWRIAKRLSNQLPSHDVALISVNDALVPRAQNFRQLLGKRTIIQEVHDRDDRLVAPSRQYLEGLVIRRETARILRSQSEALPGSWIYLGLLTHQHFGHFMVDTLPRLWPALLPNLRGRAGFLLDEGIHWSGEDRSFGPEKWPAYIMAAFGRLGIKKEDLKSLRTPTRVEKLLIPIPAWHRTSDAYYSSAMAQLLWSTMRSPKNGNSQPIYLSRRSFTKEGKGRPLTNEDDVESLFRTYGFSILSPETTDFNVQCDFLAGAPVVAGTVGSNMFNSVFAVDNKNLIIAPISHLPVAPVNLGRSAGADTYLHVEPIQKSIAFNSTWSVDLEKLNRSLKKADID